MENKLLLRNEKQSRDNRINNQFHSEKAKLIMQWLRETGFAQVFGNIKLSRSVRRSEKG